MAEGFDYSEAVRRARMAELAAAPKWQRADLDGKPSADRVRQSIRDRIVCAAGISHDDVEAAGWQATGDPDASFGAWIVVYERLLEPLRARAALPIDRTAYEAARARADRTWARTRWMPAGAAVAAQDAPAAAVAEMEIPW